MKSPIHKSYFNMPEDSVDNIRAKAEEFKKQISTYFDAIEINEAPLCSLEIIAIGENDVVEAKNFYRRMEKEGNAYILEQIWGVILTSEVVKTGLPNQLAIAAAAPSSHHEPQRPLIKTLAKSAVTDMGIRLQDFLESDEPLTPEMLDKLRSARTLYDQFVDADMGQHVRDKWSPAVLHFVASQDVERARQILKEDAAPKARGPHLTLVKS